MFRKVVVPDHVFDVQVLKYYEIRFIHDLLRDLMQKLVSEIPDLLVDLGNLQLLLDPVLRALDLPGKSPLCSSKFLLHLYEISRVAERLAG